MINDLKGGLKDMIKLFVDLIVIILIGVALVIAILGIKAGEFEKKSKLIKSSYIFLIAAWIVEMIARRIF